MAEQQQQIEQPQEQQWQPQYDKQQTRRILSNYKEGTLDENQLDALRQHAQYHNLPFYEGDFSIFKAIRQAGSGLLEGFTTLRTGSHPDNAYTAVARSIGHLVGFVPGILSGPLKALGVMSKSRGLVRASQAIGGLKSVPMLGADYVTKAAKKIVNPALKGAMGSRFKAADTASKFFMAEKAAHMVEGAFHLGTASAISSVWDGVDQMMHSFMGGAVAGGVFRGIGNVIPGTTAGDKTIKAMAGGMFMGLPSTMRGATTPEQIYEYLAGAYFGGKETNWIKHRARKGIQEFEKQASKDPKLEVERQVEDMEGFENYPEPVQSEMKKLGLKAWGSRDYRNEMAFEMMKFHGITEQIPESEWATKGYGMLSNIRKGRQKRSKEKAHKELGVATSGGAKGADSYWSKILDKYGMPVIHYMPENQNSKRLLEDYFKRYRKGHVKGIDRGLRDHELQEAGPSIEKANTTLKRKELSEMPDWMYDLIARNYYQVRHAKSIFAVGEIESGRIGKDSDLNGTSVKGGTGWAVQMGIDKGLSKIYVFDQGQKLWFKWSNAKGRFFAQEEVPKLTENPALIGSRNIKPEGMQAIRDVAEKTFGEKKLGYKPKKEDVVPEAEIPEYHQKTLKNLQDIHDELNIRKVDLSEINSDLANPNIGKVEKKRLVSLKKDLEVEIKEWEGELERNQNLAKTQYIDYNKDFTEVINDIDTGMRAADFPLMKKGEYFAKEYLSDVWDTADTKVSKRNRMLEVGKKVETIIREHTEKGEKNVKALEAIKRIEKEIGGISEGAKRTIRKWLTEQNLGQQVIFLKTAGGRLQFTDPSNPTSSTGQSLRQVEPPKVIEEVFKSIGGKYDVVPNEVKSTLVVFDSIARRKKNGMTVDVPLNKLINHLRFTEDMKEGDAVAAYQKLKGRIIRDLESKHNLYPLGGQGDKGRMVFAKFHPEANKDIKRKYLTFIRTLKKKHKDSYRLLEKDKTNMKKTYGVSGKSFERMVVSNIGYDLALNGYKWTPENIATLSGDGFIPSAVAYNKRAQIWMTNGYSGNKEFIQKELKALGAEDLSIDGNYNIRLISDPTTPRGKKTLEALNVQLEEHVDGAILVRDDVIAAINKDAGAPESGQNKSFIIDNTPFTLPDGTKKNMGALLGKYMMHNVGKEGTADMKNQGVHMIIMTSAAKQTGERVPGSYNVHEKKGLEFYGGETYEMDPSSVKYNSSVVNDKHMVQKQIWVKQLFTNLHPYADSPISEDMIKDIHQEVIKKAFKGNDTVNKELDNYLKNLGPGNADKVDFLLRNLEDIGTEKLIKALRTPGAERFAEGAMQQMLRVVEKDIESSFQDGSISAQQRAEAMTNLRDAISPIDRLLQNVAIVGETALEQGKSGFSGYMHKFVRDYRASVLHNYFVKSITRPKTDNSAVARIRPYDKWMQKDFKNLQKDDRLFYLDEAYRQTRIKLPNEEPKSLGELWDSPSLRSKYKDVFSALVLRVPMDSMSGAHNLRFQGFTGRKGHGIMMHSRTMRALGGADLDGDEAFIYFGGKSEAGVGHGMKQSWIKAIDANKNEYYEKDKKGNLTGHILHNKNSVIEIGPYKGKTYKKILTIEAEPDKKILTPGAEPDNPMKKSKALYYSPYSRLLASEGAVAGRDLLGMNVVNSQVMKSAFSSLMKAKNKESTHVKFIKGKGLVRITITPKSTDADLKYQREMIRAQIAFGSDPLDEAGLAHPDFFFKTLHDAHFNTKWELKNKKTGKYKEFTPNEDWIKPSYLKAEGGLLHNYKEMNNAYFSRNWAENRNFTMDEVNQKASLIKNLNEDQKNTMLPKIVETLEGLDWSDNLFRRINFEEAREAYAEVNRMAKEFKWLKPILDRSSFDIPYNKHVQAVINYGLHDRFVRRDFANDSSPNGLKKFLEITKHTVFHKEFKDKKVRDKLLYDNKERLNILNQMTRQAEDFMSNDLADMATIMNLNRLFKKYRYKPKKIAQIHRAVEKFKARSYLARGERDKIDYGAHLEDEQGLKNIAVTEEIFEILDKLNGVATKQKDMIGDERSASWDQFKMDEKIYDYKSKLTLGERELFDHLMVGSLNRGNMKKVYEWLERLEANKWNPNMRDIATKLINEAARTSQSRLGINSEVINPTAIQNHFLAMNDVYSKMWKPPTKKETEKITKDVEDNINDMKIAEENVVDELVQGAHKGTGYAGIKEGEVTAEDKKIITDIGVILKKYNNKLGNNIPDLNQQIRGIMEVATGKGKDLNALNKQDFKIIRNYLQDIEGGTVFQQIWRTTDPEMQKRYYMLFPETTNRELMAHDIKWLKKEGYFVNKEGEVKKGLIRRPTYFLDILQNWIHKSNSLSTGKAEQISKEIAQDFIHLSELKEGNALFKIAIAQKELGIKNQIENSNDTPGVKEWNKQVYDILKNTTQAEFKWDKLKNKDFTVSNDTGERITATGYEIVNGSKAKGITGIKDLVTKRFESLFKLIRGNEDTFNTYKTGKYFDDLQTQPIMNWRRFVKDAEIAFEKGEEIKMDIGIDGMRHVMRSMLHELRGKDSKYNFFKIDKTKHFDFSTYWPHMFFNKGQAERAMKNAIKHIQNDGTLTKEQRQKAIDNIAIKHKTLTGDWEFQDMQDFDQIDVLELQKSHNRIASKKAEKAAEMDAKGVIKWTEVQSKFGNMASRKGHVAGWSTDMNVMDAYVKNLTNTYYRQLNQIMGRKVIDDAYHRMKTKFGNELATRWQTYFKLFVQGAMGQPDVIPTRVYEDKKMKIKGTPYGWWADNRVLDRVNSIREKLGIRESDLPKELKDFTYQDLRHWSNLEAKFELASLLAHPKSSITNIFGGSLHTIQSAGPGALIKARSIKFLKRINKNWNSMQDITDFVTKHGVVPEFMIHELGLGKEIKGFKGIEGFIKDLSTKINSKDPIERAEIRSIGKKHGIGDTIIAKAAKFMSVPERMLRRDAFMAHYIRAWERFGGAIKDPEHPFLIEMAKKGVKATQFLYEAPQRPFFARTALGKVMTRFHLYAWNSARFRNDVVREAKIYGFKPGTEAYNKFTRTMQIDLFVLALANMFAYSLFDNALPQPYGWFQDTSEWLFGDEKERNRAFYGAYPTKVAPLQAISPPIARFPVSALMQWARDDYTKFTDYQIYTMFPFGRMYRDIFQGDKGLIDNPSRILEKLAGMPIRDVQKFTTERKKKIEEGTRYKQPKPGIF